MALDLSQQQVYLTNQTFILQVRQAAQELALSITQEPTTTANHANRLIEAAKIIEQPTLTDTFLPAIVAALAPSLSVDTNGAPQPVADTLIQTTVATLWGWAATIPL